MLHFSLESRYVGGDSKHFFLFLDKILVLFFVFRQLRAGRGPCFQSFRGRFARVAVEVDAPRSSSDEPVSADLRM